MFITAGIAATTSIRFLLVGEKARGIVVAVEEDDEGMRRPTVEFATGTGEIRVHKGRGSTADYRVGRLVVIRFVESNRKASIISSSFDEMWRPTTMILLGGFFMTGLAVAFHRFRPR
jgi:hypothetical protein